MAEFVGGKSVVVDIGEPITFENKTDTVFGVSCGVVFRKSGLYRVSVNDQHTSVSIEPEPKTGEWVLEEQKSQNHIENIYICSSCKNFEAWGKTELYNFCPNCGAKMSGAKDD